MKLRPLFNGGMYKRDNDDGRVRIPLTALEAEMVFHDPEVPGPASPSSIGSELSMAKYASEFCDLAVGDELLIGLVPDASFVRGLFMMSFDQVAGFTGELDLVSVPVVAAAVAAANGNLSDPGVLGLPRTGTGTNQVDYDFSNGLGHATKDAIQQAELYGGAHTDYRNNGALVSTAFATTLTLPLAEPQYLRFTITALGSIGTGTTSCCSTCEGDAYPTFQVGAVYDVLCADKQRVRNFCNCPENLCGEDCPTPADVTAPVITTFAAQNGTVGVAIAPINLNVLMAPTETIVTWAAANLPPGLSIDSGTGVISGTPATVAGSPFTVSVTATDTAGNDSTAVDFNIVVA